MPNDEWRTPPEILSTARRVVGDPRWPLFDPYSSDKANEAVRAGTYRTKDNPVTEEDWFRSGVWCNPPYSRGMIKPSVMSWMRHTHTDSFLLINADTRTSYFRELSKCPFTFRMFCGPIAFLDVDGKPQRGNPIGQALFYRGDDPQRFFRLFAVERGFYV